VQVTNISSPSLIKFEKLFLQIFTAGSFSVHSKVSRVYFPTRRVSYSLSSTQPNFSKMRYYEISISAAKECSVTAYTFYFHAVFKKPVLQQI